jgi:hypothetical protein
MNPVPAWGSVLHNLYALQPRRIDSAFDTLLDKEVNISKALRTKASESQNHLRDFLCSEASRDTTFPTILSNADADFLGGSFARHTKNWPLDDIDIYLPLDGWNLFYLSAGRRLPYVVRSDGPRSFNPLLLSRWMDGIYVSSSKIVSEFTRALRRHYPAETKVSPNGTSVTVRLTHGETQDADGLGYDVVPCFSLKPDDPNELDFYLMPDGRGGWMKTNPKLDTEISDILQKFNKKFYRKVVKLIKYWNHVQLDAAFSSYYIEFAICQIFLARKTANQLISSISEGLTLGFEALLTAYTSGDQTSWIVGAPPIQRPHLTALQLSKMELVQSRAALAWDYEQASKEADALRHWSLVFGQPL